MMLRTIIRSNTGLTEVAKVLRHVLVALAVFGNQEVALGEGTECLEERAGSKELGFDGKPGDVGSGAALGDSVTEVIVGDGAEEPCSHDAVHEHPIGRVGCDDVGKDVMLQGKLADCEEEGLVPSCEEGGVEVEDEGHEGADILHGNRLHV